MMAQRYQGPDGTIYEELPGGGYAVVSSGQPQQPYTIGQVDPAAQYEAPKAALGVQGAQLSNQRTAQQMALDAARLPVAAQVAEAEARKATADAAKAERELAGSNVPKTDQEKEALRNEALSKIALGLSLKNRSANGWFTTGFGSGIAGSFSGTPAYDLKQDTATLQNAGALQRIMEMAAQNGGKNPLTPLSNSDFQALSQSLSNLDPAQSDEQYQRNVQRVVDLYKRAYAGAGGADLAGDLAKQTSPADQRRQNDPHAVTIGNAGPPSGGNPQGPRGYDVGGIAGGVGAPRPGSGGGFSNAAGLEMAQRLSKAYTAGADVSALNKILRENGYQEFTDPQSIAAIQKRGPLNFAPPQVDDARSGLGRAIGDNLNNGVGAYTVGAADALTAGNLDTLGGGQTKLAQQYLEKNNPTASLLGTVTGGALAAGGAELGLARAGLSAGRAALAGDALYGGAYGAGSADGGNRLLGALAGATGGAVGGIAGRGVAAGAGRVARGVQNTDVAALREAGIPTTVGQTLGGVTKSIEDRLSGLPGIDVLVNARRREGIEALRPAAVRTAVDGIPGNVTATDGRTAIEQGRQAVGDAYDSALGGVNLTIDPAYKRELGAALQGANSLPGPLRDTFTSTLENRVSPQFNGQTLDGRGLQGAVQGLRKDSGDLIRRNEIQSDLFADRATDVEEALFNLAERQAPGTPDALMAANRANRGLSIVEEASARAMNNGGDFTAAQLGQSIRQNSRRFNGIKAMNSGKAPLQALQEAAQNVLPNAVPDSGTVGRSVVAGGLGLLGSGSIGGGAGYATGGDVGAGAGTGLALAALLAAGGTKTGQKALVKALADRPDALVQFGNKVIRGSKYGGIFGAPLVAPIATGIVAQ